MVCFHWESIWVELAKNVCKRGCEIACHTEVPTETYPFGAEIRNAWSESQTRKLALADPQSGRHRDFDSHSARVLCVSACCLLLPPELLGEWTWALLGPQ